MPIERAVTAYQRERLNCAQSVLKGFQDQKMLSDEKISEFRGLGHGKADAGLCGALYAARQLMDTPSARDRLSERFISQAGSDKCREIRSAGRIPCVECVRLAAGLVVEYQNTKVEFESNPGSSVEETKDNNLS